MNGWTIAAFLVGWFVGTFMSWRKIRRSSTITNLELLELVRQHKELREEIAKRDAIEVRERRRILSMKNRTKH